MNLIEENLKELYRLPLVKFNEGFQNDSGKGKVFQKGGCKNNYKQNTQLKNNGTYRDLAGLFGTGIIRTL